MSSSLEDIPFGTVITGINLTAAATDLNVFVQDLREQLKVHRLVIFRNQHDLTTERFLEMCSALGELDYRGFDQHPESPSPYILSVANDSLSGYQNVGTAGFHTDGGFLEKPNEYSIYRIVKVPVGGQGTVFIPCNEIYDCLGEEKRDRWEKLYLLRAYKYIKRHTTKKGYVVHPLVYTHPVTRKKTLYLAQGKVSTYVWNYGSADEEECSRQESEEICKEIDAEIQRHRDTLFYHHMYLLGDIVIADNLALGHMAHPDTQLSPEEVGLRILHRVVTKGKFQPLYYKNLT